MSDSTVDCPTGFTLVEDSGVRACGRPVGLPGSMALLMVSIILDQMILTATIWMELVSHRVILESMFAWSLMCGLYDSKSSDNNCPCRNNNAQSLHPFIGHHYFCESGNPSTGGIKQLYKDDPLWDGEGCGSEEQACCTAPGLPWFHRSLDTSTDYLELRVCGDQDSSTNEDVPVSFYELYVK